ncbi:MAG TPA: NCS1 family nucleobase:cation symporter-1 [Candidatus Dormibacteraeota bacterium]|nr:NCS1 family nucleobase:cation symporter-1 [Candidatus Dormibacteraeota bacterium]
MASAVTADEVVHPDGRHELRSAGALAGSPLYNADLAPVPIERRTWTTYNYCALWIGMAHNIPTYLLASGLIALGMAWYQAVLTIALGNLIVLIPMLLNSHGGTKYGIPFPVLARASFGVFGANLPALLRAFIACGWFGIQSWIGGEAVFTLMGALLGPAWSRAATVLGNPWTLWLSFAIFWVIQMAIILRGMDTLRRFENWAAPFVLVVALFLLAWMVIAAHGFGPILGQGGKVGWGPSFWTLFFPSLMAMLAFWSTLSLNMPDFTRFGASQRQQALGQALGLPTTMTFFPLLSVLITSATVVVYGKPIWDPVALTGQFTNPLVVVVALFTLAVATISVNVAANTVAPSYDFSNLWPKAIGFRTGSLITGVLGILIQPWRLLADPHVYVFTWLGFYGGLLGSVAGVLIADYWLVRRTELRLTDLYRTNGIYSYTAGWNARGVVSIAVGAVLAVGGAYTAAGTPGPFPSAGLIWPLRPLYDYSWVVGFVVALALYFVLTALFPAGREERERRAPAAT